MKMFKHFESQASPKRQSEDQHSMRPFYSEGNCKYFGINSCFDEQERLEGDQWELDNEWVDGILHVDIVKVTDLRLSPMSPRLSSLNPYIVLSYGKNRAYSQIAELQIDGSLIFNLSCDFPIQKSCLLSCKIELYDWRSRGSSNLLGELCFHSKILNIDCLEKRWLPLVRTGISGRKKPAGNVECQFKFLSFNRSNNNSTLPTPVLRVSVKNNVGAGALQYLIDGKRFSPFLTYKMPLWNVLEIMGKTPQHWNEGYDNAQRIFGSGLRPASVRGVVRLQHHYLYHHTRAHLFVSNGSDFVDCVEKSYALDSNHTPAKTKCRFTYVIRDDYTLHFSATSPKFAQDFLSKHALHSDCSESVVYAGEFFVDDASDRYLLTRKQALVFDNNSGTYSPDKNLLGNLKRLLEFNFGNRFVDIITLDRNDPELQILKNINKIE